MWRYFVKINWIRDPRQIFLLALYCIINYWHLVESYTVTPASRMNPDRGLNLLGQIHFVIWAAAPLIAWGLFLWVLVAGLKLHVFRLPPNSSTSAFKPYAPTFQQMIGSIVLVGLAASLLFGTGRLAVDIFEINFYAGQFHMDTTYYEAFMRFIQTIVVYISVSLFIVYKNYDEVKTDQIIRAIIIALIAIYVPGYVIFFIGQSMILDAAWWFPIPDGHGWSKSQIDMANTFSLLSKWLPLVFAAILFGYILKRLRRVWGGSPGSDIF